MTWKNIKSLENFVNKLSHDMTSYGFKMGKRDDRKKYILFKLSFHNFSKLFLFIYVSAHANLERQADPNNHKFLQADFSIL
jgi:hypothetical protein